LQIIASLPISHETLHQHVQADKPLCEVLWKNLRCQKQKRKSYASGHDRSGQIPNRSLFSERPSHIEVQRQVAQWEYDTVTGASHIGAVAKKVERKCEFAVLAKVLKKLRT